MAAVFDIIGISEDRTTLITKDYCIKRIGGQKFTDTDIAKLYPEVCTVVKLAVMALRRKNGIAYWDRVGDHYIKKSGTPITVLHLSGRAENVLKRMGITTIDEFRAVKDADVLKVRGAGPGVLYELNEALNRYDLIRASE